MRYVLNSAVLTDYGTYKFTKIGLEEAKQFVQDGNFVSAVGHLGTARLLTTLLGVDVPMNRVQISMQKGDESLVIKLKVRLEEGRVLDFDEIKELYSKGLIEFGIIRRIA